MSTGGKLIKLSPNLMEHAAGQFEAASTAAPTAGRRCSKMLDGIDPSYRD